MKASKLSGAVRAIKVTWDGEDVPVTYRLGAINSKLGEWIEEHGNDKGSLHGMVERLVESWGIEDEDGEEIPVTQVLTEIDPPTPFLTAVVKSIFQDANPN
ncbi:MAG: hypothetical protein M3P51_04585 [Chloroflexota bacterium]|nr:hypothetical protein [Chloroflexota bacterium]